MDHSMLLQKKILTPISHKLESACCGYSSHMPGPLEQRCMRGHLPPNPPPPPFLPPKKVLCQCVIFLEELFKCTFFENIRSLKSFLNI